jgi:hypothetical protein
MEARELVRHFSIGRYERLCRLMTNENPRSPRGVNLDHPFGLILWTVDLKLNIKHFSTIQKN